MHLLVSGSNWQRRSRTCCFGLSAWNDKTFEQTQGMPELDDYDFTLTITKKATVFCKSEQNMYSTRQYCTVVPFPTNDAAAENGNATQNGRGGSQGAYWRPGKSGLPAANSWSNALEGSHSPMAG